MNTSNAVSVLKICSDGACLTVATFAFKKSINSFDHDKGNTIFI